MDEEALVIGILGAMIVCWSVVLIILMVIHHNNQMEELKEATKIQSQ